MFLIAYLPLNDIQVFAENNYYMVIYCKMKQSIQSNQCKILLLLSSLMLGERAFLSNLIPLHLFKSLACKQKL